MSAEGINQVAVVLQRTLSHDNQIRKHAEAELKNFERVAGIFLRSFFKFMPFFRSRGYTFALSQ
jgi:hypothetical protein